MKEGGKLHRVRQVAQAAAFSGLLLMPACGDGNSSTAHSRTETSSQPNALIDSSAYLRQLQSRGKVDTLQIPGFVNEIIIHNASGYNLDSQAVSNVYMVLGALSETPIRMYSFTNNRGEARDVVFTRAVGITKSETFLINKTNPKPAWNDGNVNAKDFPGATARVNEKAYSFASEDNAPERNYKNESQSISSVFLTEACNQVIVAGVIDPKTGNLDTDINELLRAQEVVCNSISIAMSARMMGMTYAEYAAYAAKQKITINGAAGLLNVAPSKTPEVVYNAMPQNLQVLK